MKYKMCLMFSLLITVTTTSWSMDLSFEDQDEISVPDLNKKIEFAAFDLQNSERLFEAIKRKLKHVGNENNYKLFEALSSALNEKNKTLCSITDLDGWNILHHAVRSGRVDVINILLLSPEKLDLLFQCENGGDTPLHWALVKDNTNVVDVLLIAAGERAGELLLVRNIDGKTALDTSKKWPRPNITAHLEKTERLYVKSPAMRALEFVKGSIFGNEVHDAEDTM